MNHLEHLNLSYNSLGLLVMLIFHEDFGVISESLRELFLTECSLDEALGDYIITQMSHAPDLESLDMSFNSFKDSQNIFQSISMNCGNLKNLTLESCRINGFT